MEKLAKVTGLLFIFLALFVDNAVAQNKMVVDHPPGLTYFGGRTEQIKSLEQLPPPIDSSLRSAMIKFLGDFYSKVHFVYGQVIDLKNNDFVPKDGSKISPWIPKYDLEFTLQDMSIGIKSLPVNIRFDENGKLLKFTWPRAEFENESKFISRDTIQAVALRIADSLRFNKENYEIDFDYDENEQKFTWIFLFPAADSAVNHYTFDTIEINWADRNDYKIDKLRRDIVY
jgi:hypothetical protein